MFLAVIALGAGCLAGLACGGSLRAGTDRRLRAGWLLLAGAALEFGGDRWGSGSVGLALLIAGYLMLLVFAFLNLRIAGMVLVTAGILANLTVIAVNDGMPVRGVPAGTTFGARHHGEGPGDRLTGLADVVRIDPLGETVSAGDLVLSAGVATVVAAMMLSDRRRAGPIRSKPNPIQPNPIQHG